MDTNASLNQLIPWDYFNKVTLKSREEKSEVETYAVQTDLGKHIAKFIKAMNFWLNLRDQDMKMICKSSHDLLKASLILDDIEDNSKNRNNKPTAHTIFGSPLTINAAYQVVFMALEKICQLDNVDLLREIIEEIINLHKGQGLDILWREMTTCPSKNQFFAMGSNRNGAFFRLIWKFMRHFSSNKTDYNQLIYDISLYWQIGNDCENLIIKEKNYETDSDITEGKFSYPIMLACLQASDEFERSLIDRIMRSHSSNSKVINLFMDILHQRGYITETKNTMDAIKTRILGTIEKLGGNPVLDEFIRDLNFLI